MQVVFIINPRSGTGKQRGIEKTIENLANKHKADYTIRFTEYAGHASLLTKEFRDKVDIVAVVGGDGSLNECGKELLYSNTALGIIPTGSGNGLARHLKIPLTPEKAVETIFKGKIKKMDTGKINDQVFLSTAGIGFDAHIAYEFSKKKKRGFIAYISTVRKELKNFKPIDYEISEQGLSGKAFMVSIANIPQFGNNFTIHPGAIEDDGLLNLTVITPFPTYKIPGMARKFFTGKINRSNYYKGKTGNEFTIISPSSIVHLDGEPVVIEENEKTIRIQQKSLSVIIS